MFLAKMTAAAFALAAFACQAGEGGATVEEMRELVGKMENAQRAYHRRLRQERLRYMSLKTMFPDDRLRALAKAAGRGRTSRVDRLVAAGVDVNRRGRNGATALYWPLRKKSLRGFRRLLEHGADPNPRIGESGTTVMHLAARRRDASFLAAALEHGGDPDAREDQYDQTPLFEVSASWNRESGILARLDGGPTMETLVMLLDAGADVDATKRRLIPVESGARGLTVSQSAAGGGRMEMLLVLLEHGADYARPYPDGEPFGMEVARQCANPDIWEREALACPKVIGWLRARGVDVPDDPPPPPHLR